MDLTILQFTFHQKEVSKTIAPLNRTFFLQNYNLKGSPTMVGHDWTETLSDEASRCSVKRKLSIEDSEESVYLSPKYASAYSINKKVDYSDPFAFRNMLLELDSPKYGSVTKDIEDLMLMRKQMLMHYISRYPALRTHLVDPKLEDSFNVVDETRHDKSTPDLVVIGDSGDDDSDDDKPISVLLKPRQNVVRNRPNEQSLVKQDLIKETDEERKTISKTKCISLAEFYKDLNRADINGQVSVNKVSGENSAKDRSLMGEEDTTHASDLSTVKDKSIEGDDVECENENRIADDDVEDNNEKTVDDHADVERESTHHKGVYVGVEEDDADMEKNDSQTDVNNDGLADIWKEMTFGLESSRDINPLTDEHVSKTGEDCDHSFILKDDIGYVCRVCGIIQRSIESIIEFQRPKASKSIRTYHYEGQSKSGDFDGPILNGLKSLGSVDFSKCELSAHPRHKKLMKPHQVEGFNFLMNNLVSNNPGGCILAHAPGSGKTFMLISFIHTFMTKYSDAKPLVILPRGILGTWKKEFVKWQIEDLLLLDFYSTKADTRAQQLEVLTQWANQRSILFIGYQQFASIVCDIDTRSVTLSCQEILLTYPSILILDEGHTPRNQDTNILTALEKVRTPRKVVLSGTLYQNHVIEVFNILNLVRPKFLKMESPRLIKRRIMSRVLFGNKKNLTKSSTNTEFFEAVEHTLLKDVNFKRKVTVIEDLREMTREVLHYYKGDFLDELPGLVDFSVFLNLTPKQKRAIPDLKKLPAFKASSDGSAIYVHPGLKSLFKNTVAKDKNGLSLTQIDELVNELDENEGVKAKFFLNMLRLCESTGEKLIVFSQYLLPLNFLVRLTKKTRNWSLGKEMFIITGDNDNDEREIAMDQFNNSSDSRVFFGSIKACGEGISLVGASRVIVLDVHLNPSVTRQAIGRAFRPGQVKKVYTYRLIAADSPEEKDHTTCFRKESISKMWFEWNECCGHHEFELETVNVKDCGDQFLETSCLNEDITALYKR